MVRFIPLVLGHKELVHGTLDDSEKWTYQVVRAHVTEVNGAQLQNNLFGKQYGMSWVARIQGNVNGKPDSELEKMTVIQVRKHATRTDIYFSNDLEVSANELE